jgi:hypothetical protein
LTENELVHEIFDTMVQVHGVKPVRASPIESN